MSDELNLPVIRWHEGMTVPRPPGHVPRYIEVGPGRVIDEALVVWILAALLSEHPESRRLREVTIRQPGLEVERRDDMVLVRLSATHEPVGLFDPRLLDV